MVLGQPRYDFGGRVRRDEHFLVAHGDPLADERPQCLRQGLSLSSSTIHEAGNLSAREAKSQAAQYSLDVNKLGNLLTGEVSVNGDLVGLQIRMAAEERVRPGRLPGAVYESVARAFVGQEQLGRALEPFKDQRTLIVCDHPGRGRLARAVKVLQLLGLSEIRIVRAAREIRSRRSRAAEGDAERTGSRAMRSSAPRQKLRPLIEASRMTSRSSGGRVSRRAATRPRTSSAALRLLGAALVQNGGELLDEEWVALRRLRHLGRLRSAPRRWSASWAASEPPSGSRGSAL